MTEFHYGDNGEPKVTSTLDNVTQLYPDMGVTESGDEQTTKLDATNTSINNEVKLMEQSDLLIKHIETIANNVSDSQKAIREEFKEREDRITDNQEKLEARIDNKLEKLLDAVKEKEDRQNEKLDKIEKASSRASTTILVIGISIILGVAALVWTMFSSVTSLIDVIPK